MCTIRSTAARRAARPTRGSAIRTRGAVAVLMILALAACHGGRSGPARTGDAGSPVDCAAGLPLATIKLPPGFAICAYATKVPGARSLALGRRGTVFVGTSGDRVFALPAAEGRHRADRVVAVASGLRAPAGVAFRNSDLYIAEDPRVLRMDDVERRIDAPPPPAVVRGDLPSGGPGGERVIAFGPGGWLYVAVGAPCDACEPRDPRSASIVRMKTDGSQLEIYARGVRRSLGLDWEPVTGVLWFTDAAREPSGDAAPSDELNRAPAKGLHFGFPYCRGGAIPDPAFRAKRSCDEFVPPALAFGPRAGAAGLRFYAGTMFPPEYRGRIFVAGRGGAGRGAPAGSGVTAVTLQGDRPVAAEPFAEGWLQNGDSWGRPVDVLVMPDGALLVSDEKAGAVYRISYQGQ